MEQEALLAAIRANPDDRTARLVYADWLDEHGDALAEYVRAECNVMAREAGSADWRDAMDRLLAIVKQAGENLGGWEYSEDVARLCKLADSSGDEFEPPVLEADLIAFETRHGVTLPGQHRAALLQVGNGWTDGYDNGVYRFDPTSTAAALSRTFPYTHEDVAEMLPELRVTLSTFGLKPPAWAKERQHTEAGCIPVAAFGCGNAALLVVRGELRGCVWSVGDIYGPACEDDFSRPLSFFEWFEEVVKESPW
jgi:uncharacterized protein (TIGR02996 family)